MNAPSFESCTHGKQAPRDLLRELPEYQGGTGRHACVICAYEAGIKEGVKRQRETDARERNQPETSN